MAKEVPAQRWICQLSLEEAAALTNHGILPNHNAHRHIARHKALKLIQDDLCVSVGEEHGLAAIVEHLSNQYVWKGRMSAGFKVRQMVRLVQG